MSDHIRTDMQYGAERRTSAATVIVILLGIAILGAVGYDAYVRNQTVVAQQEQAAVVTTQQTTQLQQQLTDAMSRVTQSDQNAQGNEQEKVMWMSLGRAAASSVAVRPPTIASIQHAVFSGADPQNRQMLRDYFKKSENLEKVAPMVVYVAGLMQPGPMMRAFAKACEPLFAGPLPDVSPATPDALYCYEFLKRRQAEGGDVAAWQKLLLAASMEINKKS